MPSTPHCITVNTAAENYDIHIGAGALAQLGQQARAWNQGRKAFVLTNPGLYELYGERLGDSLRAADYEVASCLVPDGERSKTLRHASQVVHPAGAHGRGSTERGLCAGRRRHR